MLRSDLEFASYLAYTPRGNTVETNRSRNLTYLLKQDKLFPNSPLPTTQVIAEHLRLNLAAVPFGKWMGPGVTLVPVPKSSLMQAGTLWVPDRLARALVAAGLGRATVPLLQRTAAVRKAAFGTTVADRPTAEDQYRTLAVDPSLHKPTDLLLVDDVVTTGATLLAAGSRLAEAFPQARVRSFAAVRTVSNAAEFSRLVDPCVGMVMLLPSGRTQRRP